MKKPIKYSYLKFMKVQMYFAFSTPILLCLTSPYAQTRSENTVTIKYPGGKPACNVEFLKNGTIEIVPIDKTDPNAKNFCKDSLRIILDMAKNPTAPSYIKSGVRESESHSTIPPYRVPGNLHDSTARPHGAPPPPPSTQLPSDEAPVEPTQ